MDWQLMLIWWLATFVGSFLGGVIGSRRAWRQTFVTREEALVMAQHINELARVVRQLVAERNPC